MTRGEKVDHPEEHLPDSLPTELSQAMFVNPSKGEIFHQSQIVFKSSWYLDEIVIICRCCQSFSSQLFHFLCLQNGKISICQFIGEWGSGGIKANDLETQHADKALKTRASRDVPRCINCFKSCIELSCLSSIEFVSTYICLFTCVLKLLCFLHYLHLFVCLLVCRICLLVAFVC